MTLYPTRARRIIVKYIVLIADDKKELEETKKRYNELSEKLTEKNRQYLKLQVSILSMDKLPFNFRCFKTRALL